MKKLLAIIIIFLITLTLFNTTSILVQSQTLDNTLMVCVGAHSDDIEIAISGSLFKNENGKHPILFLVVTDGAADIDEYNYESDASRHWIAKDGQVNSSWEAPDGSIVIRHYYSSDLAKKRVGGYFDGIVFKEEAASHNSIFGVETDWRTRVNNFFGNNVEKIQMSYLSPSNSSKKIMYPDGALANAETAFTNSIANNVATEINKYVESKGYQKNLIKLYSHSPEEVSENANEHPDHKVIGNSVRKAIDILHSSLGFGQIDAKWFTVYNAIDPKLGYLRFNEDISQVATQKSNMAKACWETEIVNIRSIGYTWNNYPNDPGQYEYFVIQSYYTQTPTASPATTEQPLLSKIVSFFESSFSYLKEIWRKYPYAIIACIIIFIALIAFALVIRKRKK